ncbi:hypothetical protein DL764_005144 [Monosporascus ibericus]|uniref:Uncharacterized protein n=1 Tax=Monosporascus ibericus TaxID=155417 RepID=A0A4Q4TE02_9PEZI|nr:hypothetical protein DL764_005144 [Monosporascus ibericus]
MARKAYVTLNGKALRTVGDQTSSKPKETPKIITRPRRRNATPGKNELQIIKAIAASGLNTKRKRQEEDDSDEGSSIRCSLRKVSKMDPIDSCRRTLDWIESSAFPSEFLEEERRTCDFTCGAKGGVLPGIENAIDCVADYETSSEGELSATREAGVRPPEVVSKTGFVFYDPWAVNERISRNSQQPTVPVVDPRDTEIWQALFSWS